MKNNISFTTALPPMQIKLVNTGKRYNREWIFRKFNGYFETGSSYAITGNNGSGKSTLLQIISGAILKSEGEAIYTRAEKQIPEEEIHSQFSIAAPYLELIEEMTALELLQFHQSFVALTLPADEILHTVDLSASAQKQIRYYSSGMKQRLKLGIAFFSHTPALLLDEPTSNLDSLNEGIILKSLKEGKGDKTVLLVSHRKSTMNLADIMYEMANGRLS